MITIHELLDDPVYKKYFCTVPKLPDVPRIAPPWRLYAKVEGKGWAKRDFPSYQGAFRAFGKLRPGLLDAAIVCLPMLLDPPTKVVKIKGKYVNGVQVTKEILWQPKLEGHEQDHHWCGRCRRPTTFGYFTKHHAFRGENARLMDPSVRRCVICGIRLDMAVGRR